MSHVTMLRFGVAAFSVELFWSALSRHPTRHHHTSPHVATHHYTTTADALRGENSIQNGPTAQYARIENDRCGPTEDATGAEGEDQ